LGQQLLTFLVLYATQEDNQTPEGDILVQGREVGRQMGWYTARAGLSLAEVLRVFLTFESAAIDAAVPALARPGRIDERDIKFHARAHSFMCEILLALMEAYLQRRTRQA
jgi:hypothetical protein